MRKWGLLLTVWVLLLASLVPASAQGFICSPPYVTTPEADMLPIGTVVSFDHWEAGSTLPIRRTGIVVCYYIRSKFPDPGGIIGLDDQAYVVDYGERSTVTLNRRALTTQSQQQFAIKREE